MILTGHIDIGNYVNEGGAAYNATTKTYTVSGSGNDIWDAADAFHYAYKKMTGAYAIESDCFITIPGASDWTKAGLMVRLGLGTSDANAFGVIRSSDSGFAMAGRPVFIGSSNDSTFITDYSALSRYKIVKLGNCVTGYMWDDATKKWVLHSSKLIPYNEDTFAGLAITAHQNSVVAEAEFSNVKFTEYPFEVVRVPEISTYSLGQTFSVSIVY